MLGKSIMLGKTLIKTPFPSARSVAKELGVAGSRAARVIRLMDSIRATDDVEVRILAAARPGRRRLMMKKGSLLKKARRSSKARRRSR